ncbi:hypothetical protein L227DRAFT_9757 [Lentinus tigrinus ALCF2SS1-6]|uniref:Uncharacterized protein n=1 Tax=Lentinus tigrinus ALCF2SS1-6 TaxID=1328759 RepID=A0A5C2SU70_9APHY|nr:hypothetical protein L227DRAFT_9757 [Lentinus tigrinus ALCF2SS1-6]
MQSMPVRLPRAPCVLVWRLAGAGQPRGTVLELCWVCEGQSDADARPQSVSPTHRPPWLLAVAPSRTVRACPKSHLAKSGSAAGPPVMRLLRAGRSPGPGPRVCDGVTGPGPGPVRPAGALGGRRRKLPVPLRVPSEPSRRRTYPSSVGAPAAYRHHPATSTEAAATHQPLIPIAHAVIQGKPATIK